MNFLPLPQGHDSLRPMRLRMGHRRRTEFLADELTQFSGLVLAQEPQPLRVMRCERMTVQPDNADVTAVFNAEADFKIGFLLQEFTAACFKLLKFLVDLVVIGNSRGGNAQHLGLARPRTHRA